MWISLTLLSTLFFALCEVFDKIGSSLEEEDTEWKIIVWFGISNAIFAAVIFFVKLCTPGFSAIEAMKSNPIVFVPQVLYSLSLLVSFLSLKLIPVFVESPLCCAEGAIGFIAVIVMYMFLGKDALIEEEITPLKVFLAAAIFVCIIVFSYYHSKAEDKEANKRLAGDNKFLKNGSFAIPGILLALLSAVFDAASSTVNIYIVGEVYSAVDYFYVDSIIMAILAAIAFFVIWIKRGRPYNPFGKGEWSRALGGFCDCIGGALNILAYELNPFYTDVIIGTYCVITVLISKIILKEKISKKANAWMIFTVIFVVAFSAAEELL